MNKFRKKPIQVEAMRFPHPLQVPMMLEFDEWISGIPHGTECKYRGDKLIIPTLEGDMVANTGDWIIRGVENELYPCKPDIFQKTYESVDAQKPHNDKIQEDGIDYYGLW